MSLPHLRKLQVFVSSTYLDLQFERQAAVTAILENGHIPAGMELFAANDEEQFEVIRHWIERSDIFLLILGRRTFREAVHGGTTAFEVLLYNLESLPEKQQSEIAKLVHSRKIRLTAVGAIENRSDETEVNEEKIYTADLIAEISSTSLILPPLRERENDAILWAKYLLRRAAERLHVDIPTLSASAILAIGQYRWPGNLIELDALLNRALCLSSKPTLDASDIGLPETSTPTIKPLAEAVDEFRANYIDHALAHFSGNRTHAARALGVDARTIFRHLKQRTMCESEKE
jgi:DNA-binding NtrC family response regulator